MCLCLIRLRPEGEHLVSLRAAWAALHAGFAVLTPLVMGSGHRKRCGAQHCAEQRRSRRQRQPRRFLALLPSCSAWTWTKVSEAHARMVEQVIHCDCHVCSCATCSIQADHRQRLWKGWEGDAVDDVVCMCSAARSSQPAPKELREPAAAAAAAAGPQSGANQGGELRRRSEPCTGMCWLTVQTTSSPLVRLAL